MENQPLLNTRLSRSSVDYGYHSSSNHSGRETPKTRRLSYSVDRDSCCTEGDEEDLYIQQAVVFIEDAIQYRSINHRVDARSLHFYRWYYSRICQWGLGLAIAVILCLAFIEKPSSLSITSDLRYKKPPWEPPCGLTESIEIVCLIIFFLDLSMKSYLFGWEEFQKNKWLIGYAVVIGMSVIDWTLSVSMICSETLKIRRIFRPFFLLQNSSLMKKTLKCIKRTLPEITSVILLIALHLCLFTMFGMLIFARGEDPDDNREWEGYFQNLPQSITSLLVLLTTANNPDVMIPAYSLSRGYSIFFILFNGFGTYFLMNLLTAVIYNQFRGYLLMSIQASILRRRLGIRAAFEVMFQGQAKTQTEEHIQCVQVDTVLKVMKKVHMKSYHRLAIMAKVQQFSSGDIQGKDFQRLFDELDKDHIQEHPSLPEYNYRFLQRLQFVFSHYYFTVVGNVVALTNVICICTILVIDSEKSISDRDNYYLGAINCCFILYYLTETGLKIFSLGWRGYLSYRSNIFDGLMTVLLLCLQIAIFATYRFPQRFPTQPGVLSLWEMVRLVNMLVVFRFLRIIPNIKLMALVASTLVDLAKNLRAFAGILVVVYYVFAVLGIWLFQGSIKATSNNTTANVSLTNITINYTAQCGTYEQLGYWPNNFDDFASTLVLLYNIMVVNNWQVFMEIYARQTNEWSKVYFVCWWLTSSVMWVNLFVALILENFIHKWDRSYGCSVSDHERIGCQMTVQLMFREHIQEPTEEELVTQLHQHPHMLLIQ
ncbi:two pore channel protein 2 [Paramormyrops kingsleyae]|nr:two pore calcium channel protein 2 [Paramormyrops kingsleyae]